LLVAEMPRIILPPGKVRKFIVFPLYFANRASAGKT
jgi:hypothetical protein